MSTDQAYGTGLLVGFICGVIITVALFGEGLLKALLGDIPW